MSTPADYIPRDDADFLIWANSFSSRIQLSPGTYLMTAPQADALVAMTADFNTKLNIARAEDTRNKGTVADKNDARAALEALCRQYAILIKENGGITDADKIYVGVRPPNNSRERIDAPTTSPLLNILGNTPGVQTVVYADTATPDKKARPFGANSLQLFMAVTAEESAPLTDAKFVGNFSKNPIDIEFTEGDDGKISTFYARWVSKRGEVGPMSLPISMRIAA